MRNYREVYNTTSMMKLGLFFFYLQFATSVNTSSNMWVFSVIFRKIVFKKTITSFIFILDSKCINKCRYGQLDYPACIYLFKVDSKNTRLMYEICSKLAIKTPERSHWWYFGVFIVTWNTFYTLLWCFYCWLWVSKCQLDICCYE